MQQVLSKTVQRSNDFMRHALVWRDPYKEYVFVAWVMVGGAIWLGHGVATHALDPALGVWGCYLLGTLIAVCAIDARYGIIPDVLVATIGIGGALQLLLGSWDNALESFAASALVLLAFLALQWIYHAVRGYDGLGFGDVKLLTAGALWIGVAGQSVVLIVATTSALLSLAFSRANGETLSRASAISFGPHLAIGLWIAWLMKIEAIGLN